MIKIEKTKIVLVDMSATLIHHGHIRLIKKAAKIGEVVIALTTDEEIIKNKGYTPELNFEERKEILEAFEDVHHVVEVDDSDGTVCDALDKIRPCYFGNGGDRVSDNVPEVKFCKRYGIGLRWNLGGNKIQSSSELVTHAKDYDHKDRELKQHNDPYDPFELELGGSG